MAKISRFFRGLLRSLSARKGNQSPGGNANAPARRVEYVPTQALLSFLAPIRPFSGPLPCQEGTVSKYTKSDFSTEICRLFILHRMVWMISTTGPDEVSPEVLRVFYGLFVKLCFSHGIRVIDMEVLKTLYRTVRCMDDHFDSDEKEYFSNQALSSFPCGIEELEKIMSKCGSRTRDFYIWAVWNSTKTDC